MDSEREVSRREANQREANQQKADSELEVDSGLEVVGTLAETAGSTLVWKTARLRSKSAWSVPK